MFGGIQRSLQLKVDSTTDKKGGINMNKNKNKNWNEVEETILDLLEQEYGTVHEPVDTPFRHKKRMGATDALARAYSSFLDNPRPINYNMVITAMLAYQYWTQKTTFNEFKYGEDF
jgi:hypothetical protein